MLNIPEQEPVEANSNPRHAKRIPQRALSCLIANFQSLCNKFHLFSNHTSKNKTDIIFGTETWPHPDIKDSELLLPDFNIYRRDRNSKGGGVMIGIAKSLSSNLLSVSKITETIFCRIIQKGKQPIIIACTYRPPDTGLIYAQTVCQELAEMKSKFKNSTFLLGGDFNLPDIN